MGIRRHSIERPTQVSHSSAWHRPRLPEMEKVMRISVPLRIPSLPRETRE
jgi:hypothetical protein